MRKILLIDDYTLLVEELADTLELEGFCVLQAQDGLTGLELARRDRPDLIICDINMPHMDGYEVLRQLRSDEATVRIPFFFLSSNQTIDDKIVDEYGVSLLAKPPILANLLAEIERHLATPSA